MVKLCNFDLHYKNEMCRALVSLLSVGGDVQCTVHFTEKKLREISPGDVIIYNHKEGLKGPQDLPPDLKEEISRCIIGTNL